jgi:excisionase family DNA binding protein
MQPRIVPEIARRFQVCEHTVLRWIRSGRLRATKIGRRYYITEDEVSRMLTAQPAATGVPIPSPPVAE